MSKQISAGTAKTLVLVGILAAPAWAADSSNVVYKGQETAKAVCMSILRDDVMDLRRAFKNARSHPLERSHLAYECNQMPLDDFAVAMGATIEVRTDRSGSSFTLKLQPETAYLDNTALLELSRRGRTLVAGRRQ